MVYTDLSMEAGAQEPGVFVFPASLEQIRYWTLDQLDGDSTASNMAIAVRLEGEVDDQLVERAVRALVERHEALRTTFRLVDGRLCQIISEEAHFSFTVTGLASLPESDRAAAAEAAIEEHSHAHADLAAGPLFFVRLIHLSSKLHFLAFTMHHIVCDGWSNGILIRDFTDLYTAFSQFRQPALPELPFQFADFTVWQQKWLESEAAQSAISFWKTHIRRDLPAVDLPTDQPRLPQKSYPGHIESTLLPADLTSRIKAYCRSHDATMHQVLLAAFEALIARYANQFEFLLGSTIANRTQPGMESVVGRFANPQVVLADVAGDPTFAQLLRRVSEWSAAAYAHQDLPFSRLMEEFQIDQAGAASQFLQVYFVYQKAFMQPQEAPGLKVIPRPSVSGGVNFDLLVSIVERAEGPRLQMEYNTVLFRKERILSLMQMYVSLLEAVMQDDTLTVSQLPLTATGPQGSLLPGEADTAEKTGEHLSDSTSGVSLAAWLDRQAESLNGSPAICLDDERLSWSGLRDRSRTMASALRARGVKPGDTVALRLESGFNDAAAAWALLRLGATALPLPSFLTAAQSSEILSAHTPVLALASQDFAATATGVTSYEELLSPSSEVSPEPDLTDASRAAWIATSTDATGASRAVLAGQDGTLRQLRAAAASLDIRPGDSILSQSAHSAADAWVGILLPLVAGATLVYSHGADPGNLQPLLDRHRVSFLFSSASHLAASIQNRWLGDQRLNVVLLGAAPAASQLRRFAATPMRLWSLVSSPSASGPVAISRVSGDGPAVFAPLAGQSLSVLDDRGHPAPEGVAGELALSSAQNPAQNPTWTRTGYLARTLLRDESANGASGHSVATPKVQFEIVDTVGRLVRMHGYRLRLGELEDILWQSPEVADVSAAVLTHKGAPTLAVYFQVFGASEEPARNVRRQFQAAAPGHLAGAELIAVDSIPRHPDGSPDFSLLPAPGSAKTTESLAEEYVPPRDALEASLVSIWEDVLGVRPIGIRSPFFKLGGYSLMIVRLFARINKTLGTSLPITTIFNAPTVEQLADIVRGHAYYSSLVPVHPQGTHPAFFMIHSYLLYQGIPAVLGPDYPFYGLRELDTDAKDMTVEQRAATYLDAIRSVQPHGPYYLGGWCAAGPLAVETARQIMASGETVGFLVLFDSWRPGYAAELAREQAGTAEMSLRARLDRKYRFHRNQLRPLTSSQRVRYVLAAIGNKLSSVRDRVYLKNWAMAEWFCRQFGLQLPHFMHNVSLTTLNSLKEYRGVEPYDGSLTLIRAKEAPYIPGAKDHCGWESIVRGGVHVEWAPGDHESMFLEPHLQTVGEILRRGLADSYARNE